MMRARTNLAEDIADELRQMILSGQFGPGQLLPSQKELASRFGVGVSTVREAIQTLMAVGLLHSHPGKGTWVGEDAQTGMINPQTVRSRLGKLKATSLYEARAVIEVALTEFAATRALPEDIERMRRALESMREALDETDAFVRADIDFHMAVAQAGHNDLLAQFYQLSRALLLEATHELVSLPAVKEESIDIQLAILQAIEQGSPAQARKAAEAHMSYISRLLGLKTKPAGGNGPRKEELAA
jgi:GntR family transcriptional regulator, transcriptional repressor for pyruvate dehydrogenase complex